MAATLRLVYLPQRCRAGGKTGAIGGLLLVGMVAESSDRHALCQAAISSYNQRIVIQGN
jgi:hypothetical protein